jgi:hypothetical protein
MLGIMLNIYISGLGRRFELQRLAGKVVYSDHLNYIRYIE